MYRETPLRRRTGACLRAIRADSEAVALSRMAVDPRLADVALNTLLIGVSEFFRDSMVFQALQTIVMPALDQRQRPLRILSIGCSTGAELYSVAMLLAQSELLAGSYLLGVDCRAEAVAQGRRGVFADAALTNVAQDMRSRYFTPVIDGWRIADDLRKQTEWCVLDATRECPAGPWDLVLCRNLVIYLQDEVAYAMFERMLRQLARGGFVVVGKAERPPTSLELTPVGRCVYRSPC